MSSPLKNAEQRAVLAAMEALSTVERAPQLIDCVRSMMTPLLPHGVFVFGAGRVKGRGFTDYEPLGFRFPLPYLEDMRAADGTIQTPSIIRWLRTGQPQLFERTSRAHADTSPRWLRAFDRYDLDNMAAHGVVDKKSGAATYFSFFQIPAHLEERHARILRLLVPHLHLSLQRCAAPVESSPPKLGAVQSEILRFVAMGKTNWEIARILELTDRNTKYHVEEIIRKLGVANRTEAAVKAASLGLV